MTGIKQSDFNAVTSIDDADNVPLFTAFENKRITYANMRSQLTDEIAVRFIYPTTAQLQQSNLEADEDEPNYVRCEETEYRLYKITALAAGVDDIALDNGMTATYQEEYSKSGFVLGAASSTNNALALFDGATGTQLKTGAVLSTIGGNLASATSIAQVSYPRVDASNAVTMATPTTLKADLNLPANTATSISNIEGDISTIEGDIVDINSDLAIKVGVIETWAAISTITPNAADQVFMLKQHTSGGIGGGPMMSFYGSVADDNKTQKNSGTPGIYLKMIDFSTPLRLQRPSIQVGDTPVSGATLRDATIVSRNVIGATDCHGFADRTVMSGVTDYGGYGSFDCTVELQGSHTHNHVFSFQDRTKYSGSGTLENQNGLYSRPEHAGSGTIESRFAVRIQDIAITGGGSVGQQAGIRIEELANAGVNVAISFDQSVGYGIFANGGAKSHHRGGLSLGELVAHGTYGLEVTGPGVGTGTAFIDSDSTGVRLGCIQNKRVQFFCNVASRYEIEPSVDYAFRPTVDVASPLGDPTHRFYGVYSTVFHPGDGTIAWTSGAGSPEGVLGARIGSMYTRTDGGSGTTLYVKESGTGATGWVAK